MSDTGTCTVCGTMARAPFERFETPPEVARRLMRHAPRVLGKVLDPAVGNGALLMPLGRRLVNKSSELYCVDSDVAVLAELGGTLGRVLRRRATVVNADFIDWASQQQAASFDCIVMNPPFAGTKRGLRRVTSDALQSFVDPSRCMPLEAAFLCKAHDLLKENGRLLAVLPTSIVMGESLQWLRDWLAKTGRIRVVHELPEDCFPRVSSRMYLLVYEKAQRQREIDLYNHDLRRPHKLELEVEPGSGIERLDFGYHHGKQRMDTLMRDRGLGWRTLGSVASIIRGDVATPWATGHAVHTVDYKEGFWRCPAGRLVRRNGPKTGAIQKGDLLVKRVGRNSYRSFGRFVSAPGARCSDCVFILRPETSGTTYNLLFALTTLSQLKWIRPLIERGTGASYITKISLSNLSIPTQLSGRLPRLFEKFVEGQQGRVAELSLESARSAAKQLEAA